jgi:hypothetical protein
MTLTREEVEAAEDGRVADLARLDGLDGAQLDYLARLDEVPSEELAAEHDDGPHLTDEEWAYVLEAAGG